MARFGRRSTRRPVSLSSLVIFDIVCYHCLAKIYCVPVEKETAEKRATELEERAAELEERAAKLEGELNSLRKERVDRRAEEEAAAQARDALASRLRSVAGGLSGESQNS